MIFSLNEQQKQQIRSNLFPNLDLIDLKSCTINVSGTDTILKLNISILDPIDRTKIFNNKTSQKMMKMVIFEMFDDNIRTQAKNCKTSLELQAFLKNYGLINYELAPSYDFDGHKTDPEEHIIKNGYIQLSYKKDFILPEETVENFSLGIALFYDFEIYVKEQNIKPEFIEKEILFNGVSIFDLIKNKEPSAKVNDLRLVKSLFKKQNTDSQFKFTEDKASTGLSLLENINNDTRINKNVTKLLSEKQKIINNDVYFSNAYYSRNRDGKLSFLFNIDYKNLITNNSSYNNFIINSSLQDEFMNNISLSSISILRRKVTKSTKKDKPKIYNNNEFVVTIINANDNKETGLVEYTEKNDASIKENSLLLSRKKSNLRSFEVTDAEIFGLNSGFYQYGVKLILEDSFFDKLLEKINSSRQDIRNLKTYLKQTEKTIRVVKDYDKEKMAKPTFNISSIPIITSQVGVYDPKTNSFTKEFIKNYITYSTITDEFGDIKTYNFSSLNNDAVARFVTLLELFGVKTPFNNDKTILVETFLSMLNPETASAETITLFINTYEKFINKMEKTFSSINKNKLITIENWFTNDFVDAEQQIGIGYEFIDRETTNGLGSISVLQLNNIIQKEILKYSKLTDASRAEVKNKYGFISPSFIHTDNRILNLDSVITDPESISQYEFAETEIDIKRLNILNKSGNNITITNLPNNLPPRQQELNLRMNNIMHDLSISIPNLFLTQKKNKNNLNSINDNRVVYNSKVDPSYLFLSLAKNINITENKLIEKKIDSPFLKVGAAKRKYGENYETIVPMQVRYLLDNQAKLLNSEDNYLSSIDLNSIFLFFYNSIHYLEYLSYSIDGADNHILKNEQWLTLDEKTLDRIEEEDLTVLCRIKNYQDISIGIKDWEQIKLPIYNKHFLLSGIPTSYSKRNPQARKFNGFSDSMRSIIDDSTTNRLIRGLKPPPPPPPPPRITIPEILPGNVTRLIDSLTPATPVLYISDFTTRIDNPALAAGVAQSFDILRGAASGFGSASSLGKASTSVAVDTGPKISDFTTQITNPAIAAGMAAAASGFGSASSLGKASTSVAVDTGPRIADLTIEVRSPVSAGMTAAVAGASASSANAAAKQAIIDAENASLLASTVKGTPPFVEKAAEKAKQPQPSGKGLRKR